MKIFRKALIFGLTLYGFSSLGLTSTEAVSAGNNEQTYLIEKYLISHKENIVDYAIKYKFINDNDIQNNLDKIDLLILKLRDIRQNPNQEKLTSVPSIINDIKNINEIMKPLLDQKKKEYNKYLKVKKEEYQVIGKNLSKKINDIHRVFSNKYTFNSNNLTEKEKIIKSSLKSLKVLSGELEYFGYKEYDTEEEMQTSFLGALNSVKYHILVLKGQ